MGFSYGKNIKTEIFGQSHSEWIGVTLQGLPKGEKIDQQRLQSFCDLRAPGKNEFSTPRKEADTIEILSGLTENFLLNGEPLKAVIYNTNIRPGDYSQTIPRPGHADYPAFVKTGTIPSGGGSYSGRMTAPLCIAGGIALQLLERKGIAFDAHIASIGEISDLPFDPLTEKTENVYLRPFPVNDSAAGEKMKECIVTARNEGDSVGGVIECKITGLAPGLGGALFNGLDGAIAQAVFSIPAVKGIEFGAGFHAARLRGSQNNDAFYFDKKVKTRTNHCGGILGGMSNGMPVLFRAAFKPTPSIFKPQNSVDLSTNQNVAFVCKGRHDPCIVHRAVPPVIAAAALAVLDLLGEEE